jgi:hypothetical protein
MRLPSRSVEDSAFWVYRMSQIHVSRPFRIWSPRQALFSGLVLCSARHRSSALGAMRTCRGRRISCLSGLIVQIEIEIEHIHAGLTQQAQLPPRDVLFNQLLNAILAEPARFGHPRCLEKRRVGGDIGIQS